MKAGQEELQRILEQGWSSRVSYPHLYFEVLHQLAKVLISCRPSCAPLQQLVDALTSWNPRDELSALRTVRIPLEWLTLSVRSGILQQAQWLLSEWPERFVETVRQSGIASTPLLCDMPNPPFWYLSIIQENFYVSNVNRRFPVPLK